MNIQKPNSGWFFALIVFIGLLPLAFIFSRDQLQLLLETDARYAIWVGQIITLISVLSIKQKLSKNQLVGLSAICVFVPFVFTFGKDGASFMILNKNTYASSILSWAIASVLLGKSYFQKHPSETS